MLSYDPYIHPLFTTHPRAVSKASKVVEEFKEKRQQLYENLIAAGVNPLEAWNELGLVTLCKTHIMKKGEIRVSTNEKGTMSLKFNAIDIKLIGASIIDFLSEMFSPKKARALTDEERKNYENFINDSLSNKSAEHVEDESLMVSEEDYVNNDIFQGMLMDVQKPIEEMCTETPIIRERKKKIHLSQADKDKVVLDYQKGLSISQIAGLYDVTENTVRRIVK